MISAPDPCIGRGYPPAIGLLASFARTAGWPPNMPPVGIAGGDRAGGNIASNVDFGDGQPAVFAEANGSHGPLLAG